MWPLSSHAFCTQNEQYFRPPSLETNRIENNMSSNRKKVSTIHEDLAIFHHLLLSAAIGNLKTPSAKELFAYSFTHQKCNGHCFVKLSSTPNSLKYIQSGVFL